ncbi:MAG: hypothetical protein WCW01_05725 [Gammaproteobacteria bacterium]
MYNNNNGHNSFFHTAKETLGHILPHAVEHAAWEGAAHVAKSVIGPTASKVVSGMGTASSLLFHTGSLNENEPTFSSEQLAAFSRAAKEQQAREFRQLSPQAQEMIRNLPGTSKNPATYAETQLRAALMKK